MHRGWCLPVFILLVVYGFYINLQIRITNPLWNQVHHNLLSPSECAAISSIILKKSLKSIEANTYRRYVKDLQRCPWEYNQTEHDLLKLKFGSCCNASHFLIVTQQNAPLGHQLQYETNAKKVEVSEKLHQMLPKVMRIFGSQQTSPFTTKPLNTCAVVGNGGILQNSFCGSEIDKMDFVFRFNLPPLTIAEDIGTKSDFVSANPSILVKRFQKLQESRKQFISLVKGYGSAMIALPAFSYVHNTDVAFRVLHSVQDFDLPNQAVFLHPEYLKNISIYWKENGLKVKRLSSGLMLITAAIELCKKVTLYGFWPFPLDPQGKQVPHHYYDNIKPKPGFHFMPEEFHFYAKMHLKGTLHLKVGQCH
ncbi:alpha-2,8-sialyltransferase 8E-like [Eleutherodactylus coqui]|uniref:alpha-2,8-sialyltransferase 8E-like n=1 Tax=Eleutherodactylus coqui TaxID=57060 RepID=UPI00346182E4